MIAVRMSRFWRFGLLLNALFWMTIFSSSSMSSWGISAVMNALTVTDTCSGFFDSGSAVDTTWSMSCLRWGLSSASTCSHRSASMRSTTYLDWSLNREFLLVTSTSSRSQLPRLYATHARLGSLFSQYLPTTLES